LYSADRDEFFLFEIFLNNYDLKPVFIKQIKTEFSLSSNTEAYLVYGKARSFSYKELAKEFNYQEDYIKCLMAKIMPNVCTLIKGRKTELKLIMRQEAEKLIKNSRIKTE